MSQWNSSHLLVSNYRTLKALINYILSIFSLYVLDSLWRAINGGPLLTKEYSIKYSLRWFFYQNLLMGVLAIFPTGAYEGIGTRCVKFEICYEKYHKKKFVVTRHLVWRHNCKDTFTILCAPGTLKGWETLFHLFWLAESHDSRVARLHEAEGREDVVRRLPWRDAHSQQQRKYSKRTSGCV